MNRKKFIQRSLLLSGASVLSPNLIAAQVKKDKELIEAPLIEEFVFAAHKDLNAVKLLLEDQPLLLNCTNQFVKGDFETAVGGASHMGRKDIASYLLSKGARLDIFNYAFLGYDDFVIKMVTDHPNVLKSSGPHGFNLLHHAKVGKHENLVAWLQSKGLTETRFEKLF